jgi:hypothetical protein
MGEGEKGKFEGGKRSKSESCKKMRNVCFNKQRFFFVTFFLVRLVHIRLSGLPAETVFCVALCPRLLWYVVSIVVACGFRTKI